MLWTTTGDSTGLHLLVAQARTGYAWRTAATLWEPGFETDRWVGNVCITGSGQRAAVVYAPRQFTNTDVLFQRGGRERWYYTPSIGWETRQRLTRLGA